MNEETTDGAAHAKKDGRLRIFKKIGPKQIDVVKAWLESDAARRELNGAAQEEPKFWLADGWLYYYEHDFKELIASLREWGASRKTAESKSVDGLILRLHDHLHAWR